MRLIDICRFFLFSSADVEYFVTRKMWPWKMTMKRPVPTMPTLVMKAPLAGGMGRESASGRIGSASISLEAAAQRAAALAASGIACRVLVVGAIPAVANDLRRLVASGEGVSRTVEEAADAEQGLLLLKLSAEDSQNSFDGAS